MLHNLIFAILSFFEAHEFLIYHTIRSYWRYFLGKLSNLLIIIKRRTTIPNLIQKYVPRTA